MSASTLPKLFTVEESADYLHVSKATLHVMVRNGDLKGFKVGRRRMFTESELTEFIENRASA